MKLSGELFFLMPSTEASLTTIVRSARTRSTNERETPEYFKSLYQKKLVKRCGSVLESGKKRCQSQFNDVYQKCHKETPEVVNYIICWPLKIDFICSAGGLFSNPLIDICRPEDVIDESFGHDYVQLKNISDLFPMHYGNVSINYATVNIAEQRVVKSISSSSRRVGKHPEEKASIIERVFGYVQKLLILIYFKVLYGSYRFLEIEFPPT
jgi:E3 ubiquitin-protein ligase DCST1